MDKELLSTPLSGPQTYYIKSLMIMIENKNIYYCTNFTCSYDTLLLKSGISWIHVDQRLPRSMMLCVRSRSRIFKRAEEIVMPRTSNICYYLTDQGIKI